MSATNCQNPKCHRTVIASAYFCSEACQAAWNEANAINAGEVLDRRDFTPEDHLMGTSDLETAVEEFAEALKQL